MSCNKLFNSSHVSFSIEYAPIDDDADGHDEE